MVVVAVPAEASLQDGMIEITPLRVTDRQAWQPLAVGYNAFYERVLRRRLRPHLAPPDEG
jgi:hypothetical protein